MSTSDSITIAAMGATGAGKSTFINLASKSNLQVGHSLESCTSEVQVSSPFLLDGKMITLIDTPGFDDSVKTEAEILRLLTDFLAVTYKDGRKLNGIIFFHRISDYRMGGVARKNFRLFRKLCGEDTLKNVVIATNMWGDVSAETGEKRERELRNSELFFKPALDKGAQLVRHDNTLASAHRIIREILGFPPTVMQIQVETVDEHKPLLLTAAGQDLASELEQLAAQHKRELDNLRHEMEELMAAKDTAHKTQLEEIGEELGAVQRQLAVIEEGTRRLREEHAAGCREHEETIRRMATHEAELRALRDRELRREAEAREESARREEEKRKGEARRKAEKSEAARRQLEAARETKRRALEVKDNYAREAEARAEVETKPAPGWCHIM